MKRKLFYLFISAILLISVFTSCGGKETEPEVKEPEEEEAVNLYGYEFIFGVTSHLGNTPELFPPQGFSARGDKVLKRYADTSSALNCVINVYEMGIGYGSVSDKINAALISGTKFVDLGETYPTNFNGNYDSLMDFSQVEDFDLSSGKWGSASLLEGMSVEEHIYFTYPGYWSLPYPWYQGALFFVPQHLSDAGLASPFEYYEQNTWTWDTFKELCVAYTRTDGDNVYTGFVVTPQDQFVIGAIYSNGIAPISKDENGDFVTGITDSRFSAALDWVRGMLYDDKCGEFTNDSWQVANRGIMSGRYAFHCDASILGLYEGEAHYATELEIPWGTVEFPTGPSGKKGQATTRINGKCLFMPDYGDREALENDTIIMNQLFEYLDGEDEDEVRAQLYDNFFFEENSFKHFMHGFENAAPAYLFTLPKTEEAVNDIMYRAVKGLGTPAEEIEAKLSIVEAELEEINAKN